MPAASGLNGHPAASRSPGWAMDIHRYIGLAQVIFAIALVVVFPLIDQPAMRRLKQFSSGAARLALYRRSVAATWIFALVALTLAPLNTLLRVMPQHGELAWLVDHVVIRAMATALVTLLFAWVLWPGAQCAWNKRIRQKYFPAYRASFICFLLPVAREERMWWIWLSITAGIGEELLYRGFMLHFLRGDLAGGPAWGLTLAWLLSSCAFGAAHVYQGVRGVTETTIAGLTFGLLALLTGNLVLPIVLHSLIDLRILLTYHPMQDAPDEAVTLISGFSSQNH
ncbi:CPBP family intramembrane glutamic endopeptidase [Dyella acidiphila]|uniref:CPBP family intramembrane metalloprotease n=1 Tax=Dyella acidiphila TaxID=2775866 RepID=A0ABR9GA13_9GAMM|nr:CPBP family intramembrane glutamic endopeptidase [Dyella acidiphila]MBE1160872.1 CPBP family intramembrane metalloprotease [Dyella acidiphila]